MMDLTDGTMKINPINYVIHRQYDTNFRIKDKLFKNRLLEAKNLYWNNLYAHYGCVNAIEFSNQGELLVSGGDDRRVLLWNVSTAIHDKCSPIQMRTNHVSNIFCLAFDSTNSTIYSGGNDDQVIVHDVKTGQLMVKMAHKKPVYGLSINPKNNCVVSTAGDDGRILIYDIRSSGDPQCLAKQKTSFHSVMYNPNRINLIATANSEDGIVLWDTRKPKQKLLHYDVESGSVSGISACFNTCGTHLLALRRRLPPVLYETNKQNNVCQFYHPQYYNSCTMKTCSFAGNDDEYVLSGSDDFNLYMWRIPSTNDEEWGKCHMVLKGHRSIVNQVRYNKENNLIASSGVEKMVKLWSTLPIGKWKGGLIRETNENQRYIYTHDDYTYLVEHTGQRISHDYSDHSTQEDCRMMAFFDSLIQREIEGWNSPEVDNNNTSDSDNDGHQITLKEFIYETSESSNDCDEYVNEDGQKVKLNRIEQLIAQKRCRLQKMAVIKSKNSVKRYNLRTKPKKKAKRISGPPTRCSKKCAKTNCNSGGGNNKKSAKKSVFTNDNVVNANNRNVMATRSSSTTTSTTTTTTIESDKQQNGRTSTTTTKKYLTRNKAKELILINNNCNNNDDDNNRKNNVVAVNSNRMDVPSTSTGITATTPRLYRIVEQDSDEDLDGTGTNEQNNGFRNNGNNVDGDRLINILPTPLNGTHDMIMHVLEMSNNASDVIINNDDANHDDLNGPNSDSEYENYDVDYVTPMKKIKYDSGIGSTSTKNCPSSSSSKITSNGSSYTSATNSSDNQTGCSSKKSDNTWCEKSVAFTYENSSDEEYTDHLRSSTIITRRQQQLQKHEQQQSQFNRRKINKRARLNVRKQLCPDSDSN